MNTQPHWAGVRERVVAVQDAERRARGEGPSPYPAFEPVLTPAEIAEVEAQFGVVLPDEYRAFLAEVGSGGTGPDTLTSLCRMDGRWGWFIDEWGLHQQLDPSGPFIETEDWAGRQLATLRAAGYEPTTRDEEDDYLADYEKAFGDAGYTVWWDERVRGAIPISEIGCNMTGWLIVTGPHRGELRQRYEGSNPPFDPHLDTSGNRHTFRSWYLEWLERSEHSNPMSARTGAGPHRGPSVAPAGCAARQVSPGGQRPSFPAPSTIRSRMNESTAELKRRMPPPAAPEERVDWDRVRERWGTGFPSDFQEFIDTYGSGSISDHIEVLPPGDPDTVPTGTLVCDTPLEEWLLNTQCPYPAWPTPGCLMTWGLDANENAFFWSMRGDDPDAWPVVVWEGGSFTADGFREFPPGMADLLLTAFGDDPPRPFDEGFWTAIRAMVFRSPEEERRMRAQGLDPWAAPGS